MDTITRAKLYGPRPTAAQRRRLLKKAGKRREGIIYKDDGMGYPPSKQGFKELVEIFPARQPGDEEAF